MISVGRHFSLKNDRHLRLYQIVLGICENWLP